MIQSSYEHEAIYMLLLVSIYFENTREHTREKTLLSFLTFLHPRLLDFPGIHSSLMSSLHGCRVLVKTLVHFVIGSQLSVLNLTTINICKRQCSQF